jgi:proline racemase
MLLFGGTPYGQGETLWELAHTIHRAEALLRRVFALMDPRPD